MKSEEQINERLEKISLLLLENLGIPYTKLYRISQEKIALEWVLSDFEKPIMPKKLNFRSGRSVEERVYKLIQKSKVPLSIPDMAHSLDSSHEAIAHNARKLLLANLISSKGAGHRGDRLRYFMPIQKSKGGKI